MEYWPPDWAQFCTTLASFSWPTHVAVSPPPHRLRPAPARFYARGHGRYRRANGDARSCQRVAHLSDSSVLRRDAGVSYHGIDVSLSLSFSLSFSSLKQSGSVREEGNGREGWDVGRFPGHEGRETGDGGHGGDRVVEFGS